MSKNYGNAEIEETDNGYIVTTSYFCCGGEKKQVFASLEEALKAIKYAMRGQSK